MRKPAAAPSREDIALLCAQAVHQDETLSKPALERLFSGLVEGLCDSFLPQRVAVYDSIFAQVIDYCRHLPDGEGLDLLLKRFGIFNECGMLARKKRVQAVRRFAVADSRKIRKICVLSRVTVGADVAVTGVVLGKLKAVFPGVNVSVIGPLKLAEIFGGYPGIKIRDVPYARRGGLLGRLNAWVDLVRVIDEERQGCGPEEFLVIDPDSRLTQLGLLPVVPQDEGYYFFQSRTYAKARSGRIGELAANWLDEVFGAGDRITYPEIFIAQDALALGRVCGQRLSRGGTRDIVSINFGVGGNAKKKISADFEGDLVEAFLREGVAVILDKGLGPAEVGLMDGLVARLRARGRVVLEARQDTLPCLIQESDWPCDVFTWEGGVGVFSALIAASDAYVGYDSGFQHIAAAQGIPVIDIFMGAPSALFVQRWTPYGKNGAVVVGVDCGKACFKKKAVTPNHVLAAFRGLRNNATPRSTIGRMTRWTLAHLIDNPTVK